MGNWVSSMHFHPLESTTQQHRDASAANSLADIWNVPLEWVTVTVTASASLNQSGDSESPGRPRARCERPKGQAVICCKSFQPLGGSSLLQVKDLSYCNYVPATIGRVQWQSRRPLNVSKCDHIYFPRERKAFLVNAECGHQNMDRKSLPWGACDLVKENHITWEIK